MATAAITWGCAPAAKHDAHALIVPARLTAEVGANAATRPAIESRTFTMQIVVTVKQPAAAAHRLDIWLAVPGDDREQTVRSLHVQSPWTDALWVDPIYGERVLHAWTDTPGAATLKVSFEATRRAASVPPANLQASASPPPGRYLEPDRLGVIDEDIRKRAAEITAGKLDAPSKARAIYEYVTTHMAYDKTTPGWGRGDTVRACALGKGNCTDFHALFISLARADGIPAHFKIGYQIPADSAGGGVPGYHCWSEFLAPGLGWVPVDCSEAWKNPSRHNFYFGNLDGNRIEMSAGRDLKLPQMQGEPLNYLIGAYAELDGKPYSGIASAVTFAAVR